jgi:hypothetical protein
VGIEVRHQVGISKQVAELASQGKPVDMLLAHFEEEHLDSLELPGMQEAAEGRLLVAACKNQGAVKDNLRVVEGKLLGTERRDRAGLEDNRLAWAKVGNHRVTEDRHLDSHPEEDTGLAAVRDKSTLEHLLQEAFGSLKVALRIELS